MRKTPLLILGTVVALLLTGAGCIQLGGSATAGPMGVFQSADKGETWAQASVLPTAAGIKSIAGVKVYRMFQDPSDPQAMYIASRGQGLYYTYDNGKSWQTVGVFNGKFIYALAIDSKNKCTIYASDGLHIYKTIDCNRTWNLVFTEERNDQRFVALSIDAGNSNVIYGAELGGDVFVSSDAGRSWRISKRFDFQLQHVAADPFVPNRVYVAAYQKGFYRSDDAGVTWKDLSEGLNNFNEASRFSRLYLDSGEKNSVYWICKYGILYSNDAGNTWVDLKLITPPGSVNIYAFAVNSKNNKEMYYTGTILGEKNAHIRSTFYKTIDGGKNWVTKKLPSNTIPTAVLIHPEKNNILTLGFAVLDN